MKMNNEKKPNNFFKVICEYKINFIEQYASVKVKKAFETYKILTEKYKKYFDKSLPPPFLPIEKKKFSKAEKDISSFLKKYSFPLSFQERINKLDKINFWRHEYIKRHYFLNRCAFNLNCQDLEEIQALNRIREQYNEIIRSHYVYVKIDCDLNNCYFFKKNSEEIVPQHFLRFPFFYNSNCIRSCVFKTVLMRDIICWHNVTNFDFLCQFEDSRFENLNSYGIVNTWDDEHKKDIRILHDLSYHYGLYAFELFALASPEKIMNSLLSNVTVNLLDGYFPPERFLKKDSVFKLSDPDNMDYFIVGFKESEEYVALSTSKIDNHSLVIAIDLSKKNFSIKKEVSLIRKKLEAKNTQKLYAPKFNENQRRHLAVFLFKHESVTLNAVACLNDVETILKAISSFNKPMINQLIENQKENLELYEKADNVKHYQDTDRSRLIGLYIWDQIHLLNKPRTEVIKSFANSELYEKIMGFTSEDIDQRSLSAKDTDINEGLRSSADERSEIYRNYEYTNCCIEKGDIFTGEECERTLYPNRRP